MDDQADRPSQLPCAFCGASVPISWEYYPFVDVWLGEGSSCCGFVIESYQSDSGLPFPLLDLLGFGAGPAACAGAGARRELATANASLAAAGRCSFN